MVLDNLYSHKRRLSKRALLIGGVTFASTAWAGVSISSPSDGATVASPVQVSASSTSRTRLLLVYDNGNLVLQQAGESTVQGALNLTPGTHTIKVLAMYGSRWSASAVSTVLVSNSAGTVPPPATSPAVGDVSVAAQIAGDMK